MERIAHLQAFVQDRPDSTSFTVAEAQTQIHEQVNRGSLSEDGVILTLYRFIHRGNEEIQQLKGERRPGRPISSREERLSQRKSSEEQEYSSGFWVADLQSQRTVAALRDWNGTWAALATLAFKRITNQGALIESSFPPKGRS